MFFINCVSGLDFKASPDEINFNSFIGETVCKNISFFASENINVEVEDKWANKGFIDRNLIKHSLNAEKLDIKIDYLKEFNINKKQTIEICVAGKKTGLYHGVMLVRVDESQTGIGIWLKMNVSKKPNLINIISSNAKKNVDTNNFVKKNIYYILGFLIFVLVIQFMILIRKKL